MPARPPAGAAAAVAALLACPAAGPPAPVPLEPAAPAPPVTAPADLSGPVALRLAASLGAGGRRIAFADRERWASSAGYIVTWWEGQVPKRSFRLDAYRNLAVAADGRAVIGDRELIDLETGARRPAVAAPAAARGDGREIEDLWLAPDRGVALLRLGWRPPRGMPSVRPDGERTYRYTYPNSPPEAIRQLYLVDDATGATLTSLPIGHGAFAGFSARHVAVAGTPESGDVTVLARPALAVAATLSLGPAYLNAVVIAPGERRLAAADNTGVVALWDMSDWSAAPVVWPAHPQPTAGLAFHPRADLLATAGRERALKLWRPGAGAPALVAALPLPQIPLTLAFHPDGDRIFVGLEHDEPAAESIAIVELAAAP